MTVSTASWLVAPQCTNRAATGSLAATRALSALTSGIAMLAESRASRAMASASKLSATAARAMAPAEDSGMIPRLACARARADSKWRKVARTD